MKKAMWVAVFVLFSWCSVAMAGSWYVFGTGKINLDNVKIISSKISFTYYPKLKDSVEQKFLPGTDVEVQLEAEGGIIGMLNVAQSRGGQEVLKQLIDPSCLNVDFGSWINALSENDVGVVVGSFQQPYIQCYRGVQVSAYVMFDNFRLDLYSFSKEKITLDDIKTIEAGLKAALKKYKGIK